MRVFLLPTLCVFLLSLVAACGGEPTKAAPTPADVTGRYRLLKDPILQQFKALEGKPGVDMKELEKDTHGGMTLKEDLTFTIHVLVHPRHADLTGTWKLEGQRLLLNVLDGDDTSPLTGTVDGRFLRIPTKVEGHQVELTFEKRL